jgi:hypothetical protein
MKARFVIAGLVMLVVIGGCFLFLRQPRTVQDLQVGSCAEDTKIHRVFRITGAPGSDHIASAVVMRAGDMPINDEKRDDQATVDLSDANLVPVPCPGTHGEKSQRP